MLGRPISALFCITDKVIFQKENVIVFALVIYFLIETEKKGKQKYYFVYLTANGLITFSDYGKTLMI